MLLKGTLSILFIFCFHTSRSQPINLQQLIDTATRYSSLFVNAKPLAVDLEVDRIFLYNEWLYEQKKIRLPDSIFVQLINNSKKVDTSHWTNKELPSFIIVNGKYSQINLQDALNKFPTIDTLKINKYNKANPEDRIVFFFSRPGFDNSKSYAVVRYDNGHSWLMGGGGIKLYHLEGETWREMALLVRWSY